MAGYAPEDRLDEDAPTDGVDAEIAAERELRGRGL